KTLELLDSESSADAARIAAIEESLFHYLGEEDHRRLTLYELIAAEPARYVKFLTLAYRAEGEPPRSLEGQDKRIANRAWEIVWRWNRLPGQKSDGTVDAGHLRGWLDTVLAGAKKVNRQDIALDQIGKTLAHGAQLPDSRDGAWPQQEVRDELERLTQQE